MPTTLRCPLARAASPPTLPRQKPHRLASGLAGAASSLATLDSPRWRGGAVERSDWGWSKICPDEKATRKRSNYAGRSEYPSKGTRKAS